MRKMTGMEAAVRAKSTTMEGISFVNRSGKPFVTMKATGNVDEQSLVGEFEIFRGDLSRIIYDMTKYNKRINYVFNEQVASIKQKKEGAVFVEFANGTPSSEYDLAVACDGSTSRTRALGLNCGVRDHIVPVNVWAAYFTIQRNLLNESKLAQSHSTPGGRFYAIGPDPAGGCRGGLMSIHPRKEYDATKPFRDAAKEGTMALKEHVAKRFAGSHWKIPSIIEGMMETDDFYATEIVQVKVPSLHKGRFVLVGDAGYAGGSTGAGTSLAMAGAYILAGEVGRHPGDLAAGLRAYEERMRPIIADMQQIPPGMPGLMAPQTNVGLWLRNTLFIVVSWASSFSFVFRWLGRLFASSFGGDKYGLPDYKWVD